MSIAITDAITTLAEAERRFHLQRTEDESFFPEWHSNLPDLSDSDKTAIQNLRRRYLYHRSEGDLLEGTVPLLFASPLLAIAGFYDPPYKLRTETSVRIEIDDGEAVLHGRIDALVLQDRLWIVILESKKTTLSVLSALPQTLAYLQGNPDRQRPSFAIMTNGDETLFVKLTHADTPQYDLSRLFASFASNRELYRVVRILKQIGCIARIDH